MQKPDKKADVPPTVEAAPEVPATSAGNDEEIVAVIAAAIAAANSEMPNKKFRVVSFKRV